MIRTTPSGSRCTSTASCRSQTRSPAAPSLRGRREDAASRSRNRQASASGRISADSVSATASGTAQFHGPGQLGSPFGERPTESLNDVQTLCRHRLLPIAAAPVEPAPSNATMANARRCAAGSSAVESHAGSSSLRRSCSYRRGGAWGSRSSHLGGPLPGGAGLTSTGKGQEGRLLTPWSPPHQPRGDPRRLEDHRQTAAGVRAAADQVDALQVLEPIARPQVQHLAQRMGQVEGRAAVDVHARSPSRPASGSSRSGCVDSTSSTPTFSSCRRPVAEASCVSASSRRWRAVRHRAPARRASSCRAAPSVGSVTPGSGRRTTGSRRQDVASRCRRGSCR